MSPEEVADLIVAVLDENRYRDYTRTERSYRKARELLYTAYRGTLPGGFTEARLRSDRETIVLILTEKLQS